jgi:hypothetical protein
MFTLLKRYKMWILVVFGIFIMISFLLADTLQRAATSMAVGGRAFTVGGEKISRYESGQAEFGLASLERSVPGYFSSLPLAEQARSEHWMLKTIEAQRAGLNGGPVDGRMFASRLSESMVSGMARQILTPQERMAGKDWRAKLKETMGLTDEQLDQRINDRASELLATSTNPREPKVLGEEVFAGLQSVDRMTRTLGEIPNVSGPRMRQMLRRADSAFISYVLLSVDERQTNAQPEPTEEQLKAHFDRFRTVPEGTGDYAMGLQPPDRVALTRLTIDRAAIDTRVRIDPVDIAKKVASQPPAAGIDAGEHRRNIEAQLRREKTDLIVSTFADAVRAEIVRVVGQLPESAGYRQLPEGWDGSKLDLAAIGKLVGERLSAQFEMQIPEPSVVRTDLLNRDQVTSDSILGPSVTTRGQRSISIPEVVFSAMEFKRAEMNVVRAQQGLAIADAFSDRSGNRHFIKVDRVVASAPVANLDDVRAKVRQGVRQLGALAELRKTLEGYRAAAALTSLADVARELRAKNFSVAEAPRAGVSEFRGIEPADPLVNAKEVVDLAMSVARKIDPTQKVDALSAAERTFFIEPPGRLTVMLGQVLEFKPATLDEFRQFGPALVMAGRADEGQRIARSELTLPALIQRLNVTDLQAAKTLEAQSAGPGSSEVGVTTPAGTPAGSPGR